MANDDLQSLGAMLRQAREQRALAFEEVETETRIRVKFLQALESGDLSLLPSLAHARGFLRNYAQFLHLDANAIIARFGELTGTAAPPVTTSTAASEPAAPVNQPESDQATPAFDQPQAQTLPPPPTPYPPPSQPRSRSTYIPPDRRVGPAGPVGVSTPPPKRTYQTPTYGVSVPVSAPEVIQPDRPQTPLRRLLRSNLITGAILGIGMIAIVVWTITQLSTISSSQLAQTPQTGLASATNGNDTPQPQSSPSVMPTQTATSAALAIPLDRVLLGITVTRRTWALIIVDGNTEFEGQAESGQVLQYQGATSIQITVGDASAFDVTYNGQHLGPLGEAGQVAQRIFTPSGQITPTPTMTVTPTETLVPSPTARVTATPTPRP